MLTATVTSLLVLGIVVVVIVIRASTDYSPESPIRVWATRLAVATIILWLAGGLFYQVSTRSSLVGLILSRGFTRSIIAILLVWMVFRDEL